MRNAHWFFTIERYTIEHNKLRRCLMRKRISVLVMSLLLGIVATVFAQGSGEMGEGFESEDDLTGMMGYGHGMGFGMMGEHRIMEKMCALGLDEKQREAVRSIVRETMKAAIQKRASLDVARIDLREVLDRDTVDMQAAEAKVKQIAALGADLHLLRIKAYESIKSQLTIDQRKKFREMIAREPMMGGMGMMRCARCGMMGDMMGATMGHGDRGPVPPPPPVRKEESSGVEHKH